MLAEYAKADECGDFDPTSIEDARQRQIRASVQRRGQARFRQELMRIYDSRCQELLRPQQHHQHILIDRPQPSESNSIVIVRWLSEL